MLRLLLKLSNILVLFLSINSSSSGRDGTGGTERWGRRAGEKLKEVNRKWNEQCNPDKIRTDIQLPEIESLKKILQPSEQKLVLPKQQASSERFVTLPLESESKKKCRNDFIDEVEKGITPAQIEEWKRADRQWERTFDLKYEEQ